MSLLVKYILHKHCYYFCNNNALHGNLSPIICSITQCVRIEDYYADWEYVHLSIFNRFVFFNDHSKISKMTLFLFH